VAGPGVIIRFSAQSVLKRVITCKTSQAPSFQQAKRAESPQQAKRAESPQQAKQAAPQQAKQAGKNNQNQPDKYHNSIIFANIMQ